MGQAAKRLIMMTLFGNSMARTPDGMGVDRYRERQNMAAASHKTRTPPWELAALDMNGEELYRTEHQDSKEEAVQAAARLNSSDPNTPELPENVARFKPVRTQD
jgi:hypothetical protein